MTRDNICRQFLAGLAVVTGLGLASTAWAQDIVGPEGANIDWRQFEGTTLRFLGGQHPASAALQSVVADFEQLTGIKVEVEQISWDAYFQKVQLDLSSPDPQCDTFLANGGDFDWLYGPTGSISNIDQFLNDPKLTDLDWYDLDDVDSKVLAAASWDGQPGHPAGTGNTYVVPFMSESYMIAARQSILDKYGLTLPSTLEEVRDAAKTIQEGEGDAMAGFAARGGVGVVNAALINFLINYGAVDLDSGMNSQLASPESVYVHNLLLNEILQPYGPQGWLTMEWTDLRNRAAQGEFGMWYDADWFAVGYEDPEQSRVAGDVVYGNLGSAESKFADYYYFGLAINDHSPRKQAAWLLAQYFSSKPVMLKLAVEKNLLMPSRASVYEAPEFAEKYGKWGNGTWIEAAKANLSQWSKPAFMPADQQGAIKNVWAAGAHQIYEGADPQTVLDGVAADITALMVRAGYRKAP